MADTKITSLLTPQVTTNPATDVLPIVNIADTLMASSGSTRKITVNQLLGAGGTATLASATITGDLTVDTSTLKVDSANDRVGIGTASPAQFVHLSKSNTSTALTSPPVGGASLRIQNSSSTNNNFGSVEFYNAAGLFGASVNCQYTNQATPTNDLVFVTRGSSGGLEHYRIAADGVATWSEVGGTSGTAMTLNATGLGVGAAPSVAGENIYVRKDQAAYTSIIVRNDNTLASGTGCGFTLIDGGVNAGWFRRQRDGSGNTDIGYKDSLRFRGAITGTERTDMTIDATGNVGIGVTPSAWNTSFKAIELLGGNINTSSTANIRVVQNAVYTSSQFVYKTAGLAATSYSQSAGAHTFFNAPVGANANDPITFSPAMTLDASGRLILLASTTTPATLATNGELTFTATSNTNLRFSYRGSDGTTRVANITLA